MNNEQSSLLLSCLVLSSLLLFYLLSLCRVCIRAASRGNFKGTHISTSHSGADPHEYTYSQYIERASDLNGGQSTPVPLKCGA